MPDLIDAKGEYFTKDASDNRVWQIDWSSDLGTDTIAGSPTWVFPAGITAGSPTNTLTTTNIRLSGGTPGTEYVGTCTIATTTGDTVRKYLRVIVTPYPILAPNALINLDYLKTFLGVYEQEPKDNINNALFGHLIDSVSSEMENFCGRVFKAANYVEQIEWSSRMILKQYPVQYVQSIHRSIRSGLKLTNTASNKDYATVSITKDKKLYLSISGGASNGLQSLDMMAVGNDSLAELITAIGALNGNWTATLESGRTGFELSEDLVPITPIAVGSGGTVLNLLGFPESCEYQIDQPSGIVFNLYSLPYGSLDYTLNGYQSWIKYRAGYETIPEDLKALTARICQFYYAEAARETGLSSETIGDYSYQRDSSLERLPATLLSELDYWIDRKR